jgi:hypothetical protein
VKRQKVWIDVPVVIRDGVELPLAFSFPGIKLQIGGVLRVENTMKLRRQTIFPNLSALAIAIFGSAVVFAQMTPQQIQQHQEAEERTLQREAREQAQQQWLTAQPPQAQIEEKSQIDRLRVEDQIRRIELERQVRAVAEQQLLYLLRQAKQRQLVEQQGQIQVEDQVRAGQEQPAQSQPATQLSDHEVSPPVMHWSYKNISDRGKAGLAALGTVLVALAFAAGIIPARLTPKWVIRVLPPTWQ